MKIRIHQAQEQAQLLSEKAKAPFDGKKLVDYDNSDSVFKNLMVALDLYSKDENLDQRFEAHQHLKHDIFLAEICVLAEVLLLHNPILLSKHFGLL